MQTSSVDKLFNLKAKSKILVIFAHPDDESINAGASLIAAKRNNHKTYVCCLSKGELGVFDEKYKKNIISVREKELISANKILNSDKLFTFSIPDSGFIHHKEKIKEVVSNLIIEIKPDIIITHDPSGKTNHPDHILTSKVIFNIVKDNFQNKISLYFSTMTENDIILRKEIKPDLNFENLPKNTNNFDFTNYISEKSSLYNVFVSQNIARYITIPLDIWFSLNNIEAFHKVDFSKEYSFKFYGNVEE